MYYNPFSIISFETLILICTGIFLCWLYIHQKWQVLSDLGIPHDPPSILKIGNLSEIFKDPFHFFTLDLEKKKKFGLVYGSYVWLQPRVTIADPDVLKQVFIKEAAIFKERQRTFSKINGKEMNTSLTAVTGDQWKRIRSTLTPTFSTSKLKDMFVMFVEGADKMVENLHKIADEKKGRFFTKEIFGKLSMDLICSAAFGVNVHSQEGESELVAKTQKIFSGSIFGLATMLMMIFPWLEAVAEKFNYSLFKRHDMAYYNRLVDTVIKNKKKAVEKREDLLQGMLSAEVTEEDVKNGATKGLTRTEIVGNSLIMIFAGYETTANTLSFFSYCLANDPVAQQRLYQEIVDTEEKFGGLTYEAINSMKYMDMCMKESQRLYPAVPRNGRYTEVEVTVKGITIPANSHVDIPVFGLHHDEEYWEEPWKFKPERFEDMDKIDPMIFQPFGAGPRNCIGMRFALLEVKTAMSKLLKDFELAVCEDTPVKTAMSKLLKDFELATCEDTPEPPLKTSFRGSMQPDKDLYLRVIPRPTGSNLKQDNETVTTESTQ